ncbi:AAEL013185-PA [Aedes aegypti]|uniref:AAEL013185-PA n=1 Tax=Aedes aegypti TaxID=7159 RepID=Q16JX2_AEDAE|nr:AAEL013185-PA [Aedes aegypti]
MHQISYSVHGLDSVHVRVPTAVTLGSPAVLVCESDLPDEDLYSVKWYKGKHEFFRYTSKEIPSIKIFPKAGININVDHCNASHVVLRSVEPHTSGKYSCEITEAAPSFHTKIVTRDLNVVDLPKSDPQIVDMKPFYGADEFLEVECISNESLPAARLEWLINDRPLGTIQPPSRLEFVTLPTSNSSSSSSRSGSQSGTPSKKSTKSSLRQKQNEADDDEDAGTALDSNAVQYHSSPEFTVPVAAAVVASAAALSTNDGQFADSGRCSGTALAICRLLDGTVIEKGLGRGREEGNGLAAIRICRFPAEAPAGTRTFRQRED